MEEIAVPERVNLNLKDSVLIKTEKFSSDRNAFTYRVCRLIQTGEFNGALPSQELVSLLNESHGKKINISNLTALMQPLLKEEIIKVKIISNGSSHKKYWFPGWLDRKDVENELASISTENGVLFFTGKDSWTDPNKNFPKIIEMLKGDLLIVDPYYGKGTFYVLEKFGKHRKIRFLSSKLGDEEQNNIGQFNIDLKRFKNEFKNIELKKYDKFYELHDRYIIAENALVVVGHGIKNLAEKESFVIFLPEQLVGGFLPNLKKAFEERWNKSNNIS